MMMSSMCGSLKLVGHSLSSETPLGSPLVGVQRSFSILRRTSLSILRSAASRIWSRSTLSSSATQSPSGLRRLLRRRFLMTRMKKKKRMRKER
uniref:Uncharacterized protein n=1 Tax=Populus trichocarpa TaxID=3694 RepID=A9PHV2_POPTR|nr:unknown [Populus trichocarpa]